jgi:hypothetical protein
MSISHIEIHTAMLVITNGAEAADAYVTHTLNQQPAQGYRMYRSCRCKYAVCAKHANADCAQAEPLTLQTRNDDGVSAHMHKSN